MNRAYYLANRETIIRRVSEWQKNNPEKVRANKLKSLKKRRELKPYMAAIYEAKSRASRNSLPFDLTHEWAQSKWTGKCELTGAAFEYPSDGKTSPFSPSLDRIDGSKGYTQDNCRFILWAVNRFKSNYDDDTMMRIARLLVGVQ